MMAGSIHRLAKAMPQWLKALEVNEPVKTEAVVFEELYYDEDSSYGAYVCKESDKCFFVISGKLPFRLKAEMTYYIEGKVALYKDAKQIKLASLTAARPLSLEGLVLLLQSLDGLDKRAHTLVARYQHDVIEILKAEPHQVAAEIAGISVKQAEAWSQQLKQLGGHAELLARLQSWGVGLNSAKKLIAELGAEVEQLIEQNPYLLSKRVRGFGFRRCDAIALQMGLDMRSRSRQLAALRYVLREAAYDGHCYMDRAALLEQLKLTLDLPDVDQLNVTGSRLKKESGSSQAANGTIASSYSQSSGISFPQPELEQLLRQCIEQGKLIEEQERIYLPELYTAELKVAAQLLRMLLHPALPFPEVKAEVTAYLAEKQLHLEQKQLEAVLHFSQQSGGIYILNGSAGCGKTFTLNIILDVLEQQYKRMGLPFEVRLFAPTGKAAKVAGKATGRACTTIHRGLSYNLERGFEYNEQHPLPVDCVVLDESSMLDIVLAKHLFCALPKHCKVILLGDTKQLPSVGAGNVLRDLIASEAIPVVTLDVVKRQGKESGIIANANSIIAGELFAAEAATGDAFIIEPPDAVRMQNIMLRSIGRLMKTRNYSLEDIQVLCPQRKGEAGTYVINWLIQQAFNPNRNGMKVENCKFTKLVVEDEQAGATAESATGVPSTSARLSPTAEPGRTVVPSAASSSGTAVEQQLTLYFMKGDKVIHTVNNYSKVWYYKNESGAYIENKQLLGITNGECGVVEDIYMEEAGQGEQPVVVVRYEDGYVKYTDSLDELDHCYAMTIHKSQGSQWKAVIMIVMREHGRMLDNSIFYTAYTRAQQFVCVIGQAQAIRQAITSFKHAKRNSSLQMRFGFENK